MTPDELARALAPVVRDYVKAAVAAAVATVTAELEARVAAVPAGPPGAPGKDGHDGAAGRPGRDGVGVDDVSVEYDGERLITLTVARGGIVKAFPITLAIPLDRGGWSAAKVYGRGDLVSYHGHAWLCQQAHTAGAKPGEGTAWRLAIRGADKRARDAAAAARVQA
jgi:hypothetical protein